jgi:hypothetical protein
MPPSTVHNPDLGVAFVIMIFIVVLLTTIFPEKPGSK